tara:strand:- start:118 stop:558 length:441 start_codon:yes stop_codon:yes gene_type:complete
MQVLGFNFTKIEGIKTPDFKPVEELSTNVEFISIEKDKADLLKDSEIIKIEFRFIVEYDKAKEESNKEKDKKESGINLEGVIMLSATKEESKDIFKEWKKKKIPEKIRLPLFNLILNKCSLKSLQLEDELNLPLHVRMPKVTLKQD